VQPKTLSAANTPPSHSANRDRIAGLPPGLATLRGGRASSPGWFTQARAPTPAPLSLPR